MCVIVFDLGGVLWFGVMMLSVLNVVVECRIVLILCGLVMLLSMISGWVLFLFCFSRLVS